MGKFCGAIGYSIQEETRPGVWTNVITEKKVFGETIKVNFRTERSENLNDNLSISSQVSFIANAYARENFQFIKYCKFKGVLWKVVSIDVEFPRIILTLGGIYNGE